MQVLAEVRGLFAESERQNVGGDWNVASVNRTLLANSLNITERKRIYEMNANQIGIKI